MAPETDPITAAAERSFERFAAKVGLPTVTTSTPEADMGTKQTKTAGEVTTVSDTGTRGSQVETQLDRGDYSPQSAEVAKQKAETAQSGPEGTEQGGSQNLTMNLKDKSYSVSGEGAAKLAAARAVQTVIAIAEKDPVAAARFVRMAEGEGAPAQGAGDAGVPVGGKPEAVEQAEAAAEKPPTGPAGAPESPADGQVPGAVEVKLQETVKEKKQQIDIDKTVVNELDKILNEATSTTASKTAADRGDDTTQTPKQDPPGKGKVPFSAQDPEDHAQKDGDPDWSLYDESKGKSEAVGEGHVGQEFAASSDSDYKLAKRRLNVAKLILSRKLQQLQQRGLSKEAALKELGQTEMAKKYIQARKVLLASRKRADSGNTSPTEQQTPQGADTTRYTGKEKGDTGADDISNGNKDRFDSPETARVSGEGQSQLDSRHNESVKGSTVAALTPQELAKVRAEHSAIVQAVKALDMIATAAKDTAGKQFQQVLASVTTAQTTQLKTTAYEIHKLSMRHLGVKGRNHLASLIREGRTQVMAAKQQALLVKGAVLAVKAASQRFEQVSPAFRLAVGMVQNRQLRLTDLPAKVAEFIRMTPNELSVAERMVGSIQKTASTMAPKGASRLPSLETEHTAMASTTDELDGVFDDQ